MLKNSFVVIGGTVAAQSIGILVMPLVARLYTPEQFGDYQLLVAIVTILLPMAAMRMELAILRVPDDGRLVDLVLLCLSISALVALVVFVVVHVGTAFLAEEKPQRLWTSWMLPVLFLGMSAFQTLSYLPVRNERYLTVAGAKVLQTGGFGVGAVVLGAVSAPGHALLIALSDFGGRLAGSVLVTVDWLRKRQTLHHRPRISVMRGLLHEYRQYPIYSVPGGFVSAGVFGLPVIWISWFGGYEETGLFGMSWRLVVAPAMMIAFAVAQVINGRLSSAIRGELMARRGFIKRVSLIGFGFGLGYASLAFFAAPPLLVLFLGDQWTGAGSIVRALTPLLLGIAISGPVNMSLVIIGRSDLHLKWEIARGIVLILGLSITQRIAPDLLITITAYSFAMLAMSVVFVVLANKESNKHRAGRPRPVSA